MMPKRAVAEVGEIALLPSNQAWSARVSSGVPPHLRTEESA